MNRFHLAHLQPVSKALASAAAVLALSTTWVGAAPIRLLDGVAAADVVNQHPLARGEATYDTEPFATGLYNRLQDTLLIRYDAIDTIYSGLVNGDYYCSPTSALSLIKYWDQRPGKSYPNLFKAGDTDRRVILQSAAAMDTDDLVDKGGQDAKELHYGTFGADIVAGLSAYFGTRYPGVFFAFEMDPQVLGYEKFGIGYDALIRANMPVILGFLGHSVVGVGFNPAFPADNANHYIVDDPWNAKQQIAGGLVGKGRPQLGSTVFGTDYDETPGGSENLPVGLFYVAVPEPGSLALVGLGVAALALARRRKQPERRLTAPGR